MKNNLSRRDFLRMAVTTSAAFLVSCADRKNVSITPTESAAELPDPTKTAEGTNTKEVVNAAPDSADLIERKESRIGIHIVEDAEAIELGACQYELANIT